MKIGISLKDEIVEKIDTKASEMGVNRSAYIAMAVTEKIKQDEVIENLPEMIASMKKFSMLDGK